MPDPPAATVPSAVWRVLVVEDNPTNQIVAEALLGKLGCRTELACNGLEGVNKAAAGEFDLILMDCQMPVMDGYEATRTIRSSETPGRRVPIIAVTANAMPGDREKCLAAGMDDYVPKPICPAELGRVFSAWTTRSANQANTFDRAAALGRLDGDEAMLQLLAESFCASLSSCLGAIHAGLASRDGKAVAFAAHTIKGSAAVFDALSVVEAARHLETAAKQADWEGCAAAAPVLAAAGEALMVELRRFLVKRR